MMKPSNILRRPSVHRALALGGWAGAILFTATAAPATETETGASYAIESAYSIRTGYWSRNRHVEFKPDVGSASVWANLHAKWGDRAKLVADGWARSDNLAERNRQAEARELYLRYSTERLDFRAGRQVIAWGKADGMNPTDTFSKRDFKLLAAEDADQKSGVGVLSAAAYTGEVRWSLYWQPEFRPHGLPLDDTATLRYREIAPGNARRQWAARIEQIGSGWDWSLSYADLYDKNPDLRPDFSGGTPITMRLEHTKIQVFGADAAGIAGAFGWRFEMAYVKTNDTEGTDWYQKNSFLHIVAGIDHTISRWFDFNLQYVFRAIDNFQNPRTLAAPWREFAQSQALVTNQYDRIQHGAIVRVHRSWRDDTISAEISALAWAAHRDYLVRPKLIYSATDHLKLVGGADIYRGPRESFLGYLRDLSVGYAELQWNF